MIRLLLAVAACGIVASAFAQEQPVVRVSVTPETVGVGEPVTMRVTVLVPTWFTRPPVYPTFELANAITRLPPNSSFPTSERIGDATWSGIVRKYLVYPLLGANYRIDSQTMTVTYANPGGAPITADVTLPDIVIRGQVPAGAETLTPYIAGRSLELSLDVDDDTSALKVGDAVAISYTAELDGLPAIFLPTLAPELELAGVSVYADEPEVVDDITAQRREKRTLVFEAGGEFSIPGVELSFWNTQTKTIETASVAGLSIAVAGPPPKAPPDDQASSRRWPQVIAFLLVVLALLAASRRWAPALARYARDAAERRRRTEGHAFRQLQKATASGQPEQVYRALLAWLQRLQPGMDARTLAREHGDAALLSACDALSAGLYNDARNGLDMTSLRAGLAQARTRFLKRRAQQGRSSLPTLNP